MKNYRAWNKRIFATAIGAALGMSTVIVPCWWSIVRDHRPACGTAQTDFIAFYTAAKLTVSEPASLYDLDKQRLIHMQIDPPRDRLTGYYYPPFLALALAPLGLLSFSAAFIAMTALNMALLAVSLWLLIRHLGLNRAQTKWLIIATCCNFSVPYALLQGQTSFVALFLLVLYITFKSGVALGLLSFKPQLVIVPLIVEAARKNIKLLSIAAIVIFGLTAASLVVIGIDGIWGYVDLARRATGTEAIFHIEHNKMQNLRGLAYSLFPSPLRDFVWIALSLSVLLSVMTVRDSWPHIVIATLLVAPHLHEQDLALLIVPVAFLLKMVEDEPPPWLAAGVTGLGMLSLFNMVFELPPLAPGILLLCLMFSLSGFWKGKK
jgi:hypothetical protein